MRVALEMSPLPFSLLLMRMNTTQIYMFILRHPSCSGRGHRKSLHKAPLVHRNEGALIPRFSHALAKNCSKHTPRPLLRAADSSFRSLASSPDPLSEKHTTAFFSSLLSSSSSTRNLDLSPASAPASPPPTSATSRPIPDGFTIGKHRKGSPLFGLTVSGINASEETFKEPSSFGCWRPVISCTGLQTYGRSRAAGRITLGTVPREPRLGISNTGAEDAANAVAAAPVAAILYFLPVLL
mmetsp:Transcript_13852/g.34192  ORF Transcript_13852/g.34192 Transcript_13852/m.34192 type:complete len:239 (-) Transcript_13852:123-839(-)